MLTLHPPAFIETEGSCKGPSYIRGQPNRESGGVILTEIQDKYIPEFELPYRNIQRYIKEMERNWDRLSPDQRRIVEESFSRIKKESFTQEETQETQNNSILGCAKFISKNPSVRPKEMLDMLWNPTKSQKDAMTQGLSTKEAENLLSTLQKAVYDWTNDQSYTLYCNWKLGLPFILIILLTLVVGISCGIPINVK